MSERVSEGAVAAGDTSVATIANRADFRAFKREQLQRAADRRRKKQREPELRNLFLELTSQCNEHCLYCGSWCDGASSSNVSQELLFKTLANVKERLGIERTMLCITGDEPLLHPDFFELMSQANELGYAWGMTINSTLIILPIARRLADSGMRAVSVSLDGLRDTHNRFRSRCGSFDEAMQGIENLLAVDEFEHVQVTTVVHQWNFAELEEMFT